MRRLPFIPARNSRHRIAALSLYRALLRSASKIHVPKDEHKELPRGSITRAIKKAFVKNRACTSSRLVYASMAAGYKFLALSSRAQIPGSPENTQLISHLSSRSDLAPSSPKPKRTAQTPREPFLQRVSKQDEHPVYKPTYIPHLFKSRIPSVCATADGQPFLRLKKPQPKNLSRMIGRKGQTFVKKIRKLVDIDEELGWAAAQEDQWDEMVAKKMRAEAGGGGFEDSPPHRRNMQKASTSSFAWSVQLTRLWREWQIERTWRDWNARGEALQQLVEEEARASTEPGEDMDSKALRKGSRLTGNMPPSRNLEPPNVQAYPAPPYPLMASISSALAKQGRSLGDQPRKLVDPFTGPAWGALVRAQSGRLLKNGRVKGLLTENSRS